MSYLIGIFGLTMAITSYGLDKKIYNPAVLFNLWWGLTILISGFGLFGIEVPSTRTYGYFLIAVVSFNIATLVIKTKKTSKKTEEDSNESFSSFFNKKNTSFITVLQLVTLSLLTLRSVNVVGLLLSGRTYSTIRYLYYNTDLIVAGQYGMLITNVIITPITIFGMIVFSMYAFARSRNFLVMGLSLFNVFLYSFSSGSRGIIIYFAISILGIYVINYKEFKIEIKSKIYLYVVTLLLVGVLIYVSIFRSEGVTQIQDLLQTVIVYFTGSFIYFEKMMPVLENKANLLFGGAFFGGLIDIFILGLRLFGANIEQISSQISEYNQDFLYIGDNIMFNAFTTMLYPFIYDFGKAGIVIQPFLFGLLTRFFYVRLERHRTLVYKGIYLIIIMMIYESTMRWMGLFAHVWIIIILFYICNNNVRKKEEKDD